MRITMVTEGSYPYGHGGVSVWCDQMVRGMPDHEFDLAAITATGAEPLAYALPANVGEVHSIPLWGPKPGREGAPWPWARAAYRRPESAAERLVVRLGEALTSSDLDFGRRSFRQIVREWAVLAPDLDLESALISPLFVELLMERWASDVLAVRWGGRSNGLPTVADAVTATRLIAHALRPLTKVLRQADLVHLVANGLAGMVGLAMRARFNTPYILSEHGVYLRERYLSYGSSSYSWPVKWLMLRFYRLLSSAVYADAALVAPGNIYNKRWESWDGVPAESIRTVYNGVDPDEFAVVESEPTTPTLAFVGRVDPIKGIETLLRGFALVHEAMPEARLRIFGGHGPGGQAYRDEMVALASQLGLDGVAVFEGRVERIQDGYAAGNVVVLTSISEGFPYTVIEAMSCGRPTVSTDVGGVAEAVGEAGIVVPPRDPAAFAQACLRLLRDPAERRLLSERARTRVVQLFTLEQSLETFSSIYADVVREEQDVVAAPGPIELREAAHRTSVRRGIRLLGRVG